MRTSSPAPGILLAGLALIMQVGATDAAAQCITGPTSVCPGSEVQLCGPVRENAIYIWQGPGGISFLSQCIQVSVVGAYSLTVQDMFTGDVTDTCSVLLSGTGAAPGVTGPASTCGGTPVTWCGPSGSFEYAWSGPGGFAATTACVTLGSAGDYQLRVRPLPDGCWSDSTVRTLTVATCGTPAVNCPRVAAWWAEQLEQDVEGNRLAPGLMGRVAECVDDHDTYFNWTAPMVGFRSALQPRRRTLRMNAARQVAALRANVCAGAIGVTPRQGAPVSLDPSTPISLPGMSATVGDWLARADAELARLESMPEHSPAVNADYRRLIVVAWHVNHGMGIGPTCRLVELDEAGAAVVAAADPEPLPAELIDESGGPLEFGELAPNPFSASTSLAFAVSTAAAAPISIGVYDASGRLVRELVNGSYGPGRYVTRWDGRASDGSPARSGLYFIVGRINGERVQARAALVH